ncbi:MAG: glycine oxidase [Arenicella sp.]|jgi:glycine oxidase
MNKSFTIYGWGLAGATLSWELHKRNVPFKVVYKVGNNSSRVAAGLVNPVVFKRLTKSWKADDLLPFAKDFYEEKERLLNVTLLSHKPICRIFASIEEQNSWASLYGDDRFTKYISKVSELGNKQIESPFHVGEVSSIGHLKVSLFLDESKKYLESKGCDFILKEKHKETEDELSIYCEGSDVVSNPYFGYLPMKPTHGDTLTIRAKGLGLDKIVNKNMYMLPLGDDLYNIGSTYNWEMKTPTPTEEGKNELLERLKAFTNFDFEIVKHEAGLRPTVSDRRPLLGQHPEKKNKYVFNGLGTKGVMIAPYFANHLCEHLLKGEEIDKEVSIERHLKHYNA